MSERQEHIFLLGSERDVRSLLLFWIRVMRYHVFALWKYLGDKLFTSILVTFSNVSEMLCVPFRMSRLSKVEL